jgi:cytochrome c oxidase subunit 2
MKRTLIVVILATATIAVAQQAAPPARVVEVGAKRFEFTPNVITLKKDEPVTIRLSSSDRSHGLLVKPLGIDLDADNGAPDEVTITPHEAGRYAAICDHYCGSGHGNMKMTIVVE